MMKLVLVRRIVTAWWRGMGAKAVAMVDEVVLEMVEEEEEEEEEDVVDNLQRKILGSVTMLNYVALDDLYGSCALIYIYI